MSKKQMEVPCACYVSDPVLEANLLAIMIQYKKAVDFVAPHFRDDFFYTEKYRFLAQVILRMLEEGEEVSPMLLVAKINLVENPKATMLDVTDLMSMPTTSTSLSLMGMLELLDKYRKCRALVDLSMKMYMVGKHLDDDRLEEEIDLLLNDFDKIRQGFGNPIITLDQSVDNNLQIIQDNLSDKTRHTGLMTGFNLIDRSGGLPKGLTILGGKTSHGKSAMAMAWAVNAAKAGMKVAYFSFEMESEELSARALAMETHKMKTSVSANTMMRLPLDSQQLASAQEAVLQLRKSGCSQNLYFNEDHTTTYPHLEMEIRQLVNHNEVKAVFIDYLQTVNLPGRNNSTREELVGQVAHRLHELALQLKIHIVALSQMNRSIQGEPNMFHLRESGQIAEAADCIAILWRPSKDHVSCYNEPHISWPVKGTAILKLEKFRNGPTGDTLVRFVPQITRYDDFPEEDYPTNTERELFSSEVFD